MHVLLPHPPSLLLQQFAPTLHISAVNDPPPLLAVLLQGQGGPPPPTSAVRDYALLLSALLPQRFDPPLKPSNVPAPLPRISDFTLQPLALNTSTLPSILIQGKGGPLLLPVAAHAHDTFLPELHLQQGVPLLMTSNVPTTLDHISAFPLQLGGPRLHTSAVDNPPLI